MDPKEFEKNLQATKHKILPDCPSSMEANVLRRIHLGNAPRTDSTEQWFWGNFNKPAIVASVFAITFLLSAVSTIILSSEPPHSTDRKLLAASALDFNLIHQNSIFTFDKE